MVGSGRPEGSLACVARWARSALRVERVCWRVDFLEWRDFRRGFGGLDSEAVVIVAAVSCEVSVGSELFEDGCCGAGGGFDVDGFEFGDS